MCLNILLLEKYRFFNRLVIQHIQNIYKCNLFNFQNIQKVVKFMPKKKAIEKKFFEFVYSNFKNYGMDERSTMIYAALFVEPEPVSLEDLSKKIGYSLSAVSTSAKFLEQFNFIYRVKKPGSKKVYFTLWRNILDHVDKKVDIVLNREVKPVKENLPGMIEEYSKAKEVNSDKLNLMKDYLKNIEKLEKYVIGTKKLLNELK